jgi:hypothetical protein
VEAAAVVFGRRPEGMAEDMTEPQNTGYQDSPDTTDPSSAERDQEGAATLTTDDDAQREDSEARPGNSPD